ncbi:MAG TPA: rod shape-determining protein MreC [Candidatus Deferrimicrobiaceae bacterium]|nr:rod shape-determining protein MreC [Candidatus Deferrimicrobiaceae bacterium]
MVRKFLRKWWRLLLAVALLASAIQFFVRPPEVAPGRIVGEIGTSLFRPFYAGVDFLRRSVSSVWTGYFALVAVSRENADLRKEVAALREQLKESRDAVLENRRLEELLRFSKNLEKRTVGARVVGHDVSPWFQGIFIDGGTEAGVEPGMAVLTPAGAVGRIHRTFSGLSEVILLTDSRFAADVIVERTRVRAIAEGMGGNLCRLKYVSPTQDVVPGDRIVFSGFDGSMPKGILLGTVVSVDAPPEGLFMKIRVVSAVNVLSVEEVLVVLSRPMIPFRRGTP